MNKLENPPEETSGLQFKYIFKFLYTLVLSCVIGFGYFYRETIMDFISGELSSEPAQKQKAEDSATPDKKEKKIKFWRAPMNPSYVRDKPGKSPMGMDLVPVYEVDGEDSGLVKINPIVVQNIGVRSVAAKRMDLSKQIRTVGVIAYDETTLTKIQTKVSGWIEKLYIDSTGLYVKKGTVLLEVYSPDLVTTQEEFVLALNYRDSMKQGAHLLIKKSGETLLESARRRLELFDVPEHQIRELEKTRKIKKTLHIHSTAPGVVIKKHVIEGMYVKPGVTLYEIADLSKVWVNVDVYEYEIPYVKEGQHAVMTLASAPGKTFEGKITYIYPFLERKSRSVTVRLEFDNKKMLLKPDMYGEIVINAKTAKNIVTIPSEAVIRTGARSLVFIDRGEGRFEPRNVTLGMESEGYFGILSGLSEGEKVVTSAQFLIDSESKLQEVVNKMSPAPQDENKDMSKMDHGSMKSDGMDHSKMDHGSMDHSQNKK